MDKVVDFLKYLSADGFVEINNLNSLTSYRESLGKRNIYFCAGLKEKLTCRCNDDDIGKKRYFACDFDIRVDHHEKTDKIISQEDLNKESDKIIELLSKNGFGDFCAKVYTGNGLHLYYAGEPREFDKLIFADGVEYIFEQMDDIMKPLGYKTDKSVTNIGRILRLPGSINPRKKDKKDMKRDMGDIECTLEYFEEKDSLAFSGIEEFAKQYKLDKEQQKIDEQKIKNIVRTEYKKPDNVWKQINEIPACDVACDIWGVTIGSDDGKDNIPLKEEKKNMGAYRYKPHNVIVNTGSSIIKTDKNYFTSYELVYYEYANKDAKAVLEYFKTRHNINIDNKNLSIDIPKKEYKKQGYLYGNETFDTFDCVMSGELVTVIAESNSGKTSFAMDIIQTNTKRGKKCFYINLEFPIETMWESRWLFLNGKKKRNITDIDPLDEAEVRIMNKYVKEKIAQFDYHNEPKGMTIDAIIELVQEKHKQGYGLFVLDTFSRIIGNLDSSVAHSSQNKSMEILQEVCQNLGVVIINLHHTNKKGDFEGSKKIMDLSNVFIIMEKSEDDDGNKTTNFMLTKDKYITRTEIQTYYTKQEYALHPPEKPF